MVNTQHTKISIPFPSTWAIHADRAGRPIIWGTLSINSIRDSKVIGNINFRGRPIPINGTWNENSKQIAFHSPYASFAGSLQVFDDSPIKVRQLLLSGNLIMTPPSLEAGSKGTWIATTQTELKGPPISSGELPPVGAFLTSDIMNQQQFRE